MPAFDPQTGVWSLSAEWNEEDHPRDEIGRFAEADGDTDDDDEPETDEPEPEDEPEQDEPEEDTSAEDNGALIADAERIAREKTTDAVKYANKRLTREANELHAIVFKGDDLDPAAFANRWKGYEADELTDEWAEAKQDALDALQADYEGIVEDIDDQYQSAVEEHADNAKELADEHASLAEGIEHAETLAKVQAIGPAHRKEYDTATAQALAELRNQHEAARSRVAQHYEARKQRIMNAAIPTISLSRSFDASTGVWSFRRSSESAKPADFGQHTVGKHGDPGRYVTIEGHAVFIPDSAGSIPTRVKSAHGKRFTKSEIEKAMLDHYHATGGGWQAEHDAELEKTGAAGGQYWTFKGSLPKEISDHIQGRPELRKLFRVSDDSARTGGADAFGALGDRYLDLAELAAGSPIRLAAAEASKAQDPEVAFLAHVHRNLSKGSKLQKLEPGGLRVGDSFKVNGETYRVAEDDDGYRVLKQGKDFAIPLDYLKAVPADPGSFRGGKKAKPAPVDEIPFSRHFDRETGVWSFSRGQFGLFGGGGESQRRFDDENGYWRTINGAKVHFTGDGKADKGPAGVVAHANATTKREPTSWKEALQQLRDEPEQSIFRNPDGSVKKLGPIKPANKNHARRLRERQKLIDRIKARQEAEAAAKAAETADDIDPLSHEGFAALLSPSTEPAAPRTTNILPGESKADAFVRIKNEQMRDNKGMPAVVAAERASGFVDKAFAEQASGMVDKATAGDAAKAAEAFEKARKGEPFELPPHLARIAKSRDSQQSYVIRDVTPEGYGPSEESPTSASGVSHRAMQLANAVNESTLLHNAETNPGKRESLRKSIESSRDKLVEEIGKSHDRYIPKLSDDVDAHHRLMDEFFADNRLGALQKMELSSRTSPSAMSPNLYGQQQIDGSGIGKQQTLVEPAKAEAKPVGSKSANDPKNTAEMFGETLRKGESVRDATKRIAGELQAGGMDAWKARAEAAKRVANAMYGNPKPTPAPEAKAAPAAQPSPASDLPAKWAEHAKHATLAELTNLKLGGIGFGLTAEHKAAAVAAAKAEYAARMKGTAAGFKSGDYRVRPVTPDQAKPNATHEVLNREGKRVGVYGSADEASAGIEKIKATRETRTRADTASVVGALRGSHRAASLPMKGNQRAQSGFEVFDGGDGTALVQHAGGDTLTPSEGFARLNEYRRTLEKNGFVVEHNEAEGRLKVRPGKVSLSAGDDADTISLSMTLDPGTESPSIGDNRIGEIDGEKVYYRWKPMIRPGTWHHPDPKIGTVSLSRDDIATMYKSTKQWMKDEGGKPFVPTKHFGTTARDNLGYITDLKLEKDGTLYGLHQLIGDDAKRIAARNETSIQFKRNFKGTKTGKTYPLVILHNCICADPVITDLGGFSESLPAA